MRKMPKLTSCSCCLSLIRLLGFLTVYPEGDLVPCLSPPTVLSGKKHEENMYDVIKGQEGLPSGMITASCPF